MGPTPSITPSPTAAGCGNGVLDGTEQCDDGDAIDGDGCAADCTLELVPGSATGFSSRECFHEFLAPPVLSRDARGWPSRDLHCADDDPTCDFGAAPGDAACTFHVALCFNVYDTRRLDAATGDPVCAGAAIERVRIMMRGRFANDTAPAPVDAANRAALELALSDLGAVMRGECVRDNLPPSSDLCTGDADCDTPGAGSGVCRGKFMAFIPPLTDATCTAFADVIVPLRTMPGGFARGEKWIRLRVEPEDRPSGARRFGDTDMLRLYCDPPR